MMPTNAPYDQGEDLGEQPSDREIPEALLATLHVGLNGEPCIDLSAHSSGYPVGTSWPLAEFLADYWPKTPYEGTDV
jgi:hypothetical protein